MKDGGAVAAVLELGALIWLNIDRTRLLESLRTKDERLQTLADQLLTVTAELKTYLFTERKA